MMAHGAVAIQISRHSQPMSEPMTATVYDLHGVKVFACSQDGKKIRTDRDAVDLIGEAYPHEVRWIILPVERLEDAFFQLRTRIAGEIISKFVGYGPRLAIIGDISRHTEESSSLRAFIYESNRGDRVWFLPNIEEFCQRLERAQANASE